MLTFLGSPGHTPGGPQRICFGLWWRSTSFWIEKCRAHRARGSVFWITGFTAFFLLFFKHPHTHTHWARKSPYAFFSFLGPINDHSARPRDVGGTHPRPSPKWGVESSFSRPWLIGGSVGRLGSFRLLITDTLRTYCLVANYRHT